MRDLVTGATGFTGGHLARALVSRGHSVRALVRDEARAGDLAAAGVTIAVGDLRDRASVERAVDGIDVVYNVAAIYRQAGLAAGVYRAVNALAVADLVEAAARARVRRVVHCSTVGVHGDVEQPPANEDAPLKPGDVYQETKLEGERLARDAGTRHGIEVTIVRPTGIYGPGDRRLLKLFRGISHGFFPILGRGEIYYHLTYIDDLVEGFRLCGEQVAAANHTYILAGGEVTTLNQLVALVAESRTSARSGLESTCLCGRSGSLVHSVKPCARRFESSRPCIDGGWTSSRRAAHSTLAAPAARLATLRRSASEKASPARWPGIEAMDGSEKMPDPHGAPSASAGGSAPTRPTIPRAQDQLFAPGTTARQKYASLVVGKSDLASLIKYELIVTLTQSCPGALGLVLRKALYPLLLGSCGRNVVFGQNVVLRHPHKVHIGEDVVIDDNCLVDAKGDTNAGIRMGDGVFVGRNTILSCKNGDIELADGANIGFNCEVFSASRVRIGARVLMAAYSYVIGGDHDFSDPSRPVLEQSRRSAGVFVGDGAWIGAGATVLDGVTIGDGAIVGAAAVVRDDVPAGAVVVGIPARVASTR